jgi:hypothetical protein
VGSGADKKCFIIHKQLLTEKAPVFEKMFNGRFRESVTQSAILPEDNIEAFEAFFEWLYRGTLVAVSNGNDAAAIDEACMRILEIHFLAAKYCLTELADRALTGLVLVLRMKGTFLSVDRMVLCYDKSHTGSRLRYFVSRLATYALLAYSEDNKANPGSSVQFGEAFLKNSDFMMDVLFLLRGKNVGTMTDPRASPRCEYHQHDKATDCPYDKKPSPLNTWEI